MRADILFFVYMAGCLTGLIVAAAIHFVDERQNRLDRKTDEYMRRGLRMLSEQEVAELLEPKYKPVSPRDFVIRDRNGQPIHFEDDHHGAA